MTKTDIPRTSAQSNTPLRDWLAGGGSGWLLGMIPLSLTIWFASMIGQVAAGNVLRVSYEWIPSLGVNLAFAVDGLSLTFALLVLGIGTLIVIYAGGYMVGDKQIGRFFLYLFLFMGAMLGLVLADNIITLFVFWELTSISSYLLIGYKHAYYSSRSAALQALLVTGAGGLALLAGLVLLGLAGGTADTPFLANISDLNTQNAAIQASGLYVPAAILILVGCFTKSAQFPFQFWLPGAMAAPTPVSAYLHSATMVKAGVYLLARLNPAMEGTLLWQGALVGFGAFTMFLGAYLSVSQVDLKRILAFSTVSALGTLVMLIGIGGEYAITAMMVFLVVHSLYKGCLFMVAGAIDHETGSRDINKLAGLRHKMPILFAAAALAAVSMSGLPPLLGFVGKELIYEATLESTLVPALLSAVAVLSNILMIVAAGMVAVQPFFAAKEPLPETPKVPHEPPVSMWLGPMVLAGLGLIMGLFVGQLAQPITAQGVAAILGDAAIASEIKLKLLPSGITGYFLLSVLTVAAGIAGYVYARPLLNRAGAITKGVLEDGPVNSFDGIVNGMQALAGWQTRLIQSGYLRNYLLMVLLTILLLTGSTLLFRADFGQIRWQPDGYFWEWATIISIIVGAVLVARAKKRLTAIAGLGLVGYGMSLIFLFFGAPDLFMTQFSVETLSVILFILVLYRLPIFYSEMGRMEHIRDMLVAGFTGAMITLMVLVTTSGDLERRLTPYFAENSVPEAQGYNVVNVILVDFRGLDTLGEIAVIGIAALGILVLMRLRLGKDEGGTAKNTEGKEQM